MRFGVDIDVVLSDSNRIFRQVAFDQCGVDVSIKQEHHSLVDSFGISARQEYSVVSEFLRRSHECESIEGAADGLKYLMEIGSVWIITNRPECAYDSTSKWLDDNGLVYNSLICTKEKSSYAQFLNFMVEDNPVVADSMVLKGCRVLLFNQPFNQKVEPSPMIKRVYSWAEVKSEAAHTAKLVTR